MSVLAGRLVTVTPNAPLGVVLGYQKRVDVTQPAAGADWSRVVPGEGQWMVLGFRALLTAGVAVANRVVRVSITDGTDEVALALASGNIVASDAAVVGGMIGAVPTTFGGTAKGYGMGLPPLILATGWTFGVVTLNLQAADQWSAIRLWVLELPEGDAGYPKGLAFREEE